MGIAQKSAYLFINFCFVYHFCQKMPFTAKRIHSVVKRLDCSLALPDQLLKKYHNEIHVTFQINYLL